MSDTMPTSVTTLVPRSVLVLLCYAALLARSHPFPALVCPLLPIPTRFSPLGVLMLSHPIHPAEAAAVSAAGSVEVRKEDAVAEAEAATKKVCVLRVLFFLFLYYVRRRRRPATARHLSPPRAPLPLSHLILPPLPIPLLPACHIPRPPLPPIPRPLSPPKLAAQKRDDAIEKAGEELRKPVTTASIIRREEASAQSARARADEKAAKLATSEREKAEKAAEAARKAAIKAILAKRDRVFKEAEREKQSAERAAEHDEAAANNLKAGEAAEAALPPTLLEWIGSFIWGAKSLAPEVEEEAAEATEESKDAAVVEKEIKAKEDVVAKADTATKRRRCPTTTRHLSPTRAPLPLSHLPLPPLPIPLLTACHIPRPPLPPIPRPLSPPCPPLPSPRPLYPPISSSSAEAKSAAAKAKAAAKEAAALEKAKAEYEKEFAHLTKLAAQKRDDALEKAGEELKKAVTTASIIRRKEEASAQSARAKADEKAAKARLSAEKDAWKERQAAEKEAHAVFAKAAKLATSECEKAAIKAILAKRDKAFKEAERERGMIWAVFPWVLAGVHVRLGARVRWGVRMYGDRSSRGGGGGGGVWRIVQEDVSRCAAKTEYAAVVQSHGPASTHHWDDSSLFPIPLPLPLPSPVSTNLNKNSQQTVERAAEHDEAAANNLKAGKAAEAALPPTLLEWIGSFIWGAKSLALEVEAANGAAGKHLVDIPTGIFYPFFPDENGTTPANPTSTNGVQDHLKDQGHGQILAAAATHGRHEKHLVDIPTGLFYPFLPDENGTTPANPTSTNGVQDQGYGHILAAAATHGQHGSYSGQGLHDTFISQGSAT
ncbi:hypothetical protein B0H13DRAFT_2577483 [Mycena leptocephala]|nr:hypothetical protein B0H13DRAFT_2577483 [Mycena leptocephala]